MKIFTSHSPILFCYWLLCGLLLPGSWLWAFDEEEPLPPSSWRVKTQMQIIPVYKKAWGHSGKIVPLQDLLIRNKAIQKRVGGKLLREEKKFEVDILYGFSEDWQFSAKIPFWQKKQTSRLTILDASTKTDPAFEAKIQKIKANLQSEEVQGVGDIRLQATYRFSRSNSHFYRGGFGLQWPTGSAGTPRGIFPIAIGDRRVGFLSNLHYSHYPDTIEGLHQSIRGELRFHLAGTGKNLEGQSGKYAGGNRFDLLYGLSYERDNYFVGGEFQHLLGTETNIGEERQKDQFFLDTLHVSIGYGNLSDLEKSPLSLPYQIRLGRRIPLQGQNVPFNPNWQLNGLFYF